MAKKHPYKSTHIEHHSDSSHTVRHEHESDPKKDKSSAVADLAAVHSNLDANLGGGAPAPAEAAPAAAPGAPGAAPAAPMPGM